jgi:glycosyltransferase involved in cell wall biosynthesis
MRILQIITRLIQGGAQQNTVLACEQLVAMGHEVFLAHGPIYGPEGSLRAAAEASGAELIEVPALRRAVMPVHDVRAYRQLCKLIGRLKPAVVHTHSSKAGILGRAAAWHVRRQGAPAIVHTVHGLPFHDRQAPLVYHGYVYAERWAARRCDCIIGVTQAMCDAFAAEGIGQPGQFVVVPNGLNMGKFVPSPAARRQFRSDYGIPADAPTVGIVARLDTLKGQSDLLDITPELLALFPELRVVFVGDGWLRPALEARVRGQSWCQRVIFTGMVGTDQVPAAMAGLDVMALPSYQEGQGRTLAEALLCGCAIAAYDVGGISEICVGGETGLLAPVGDRAALKRAIAALLGARDESRRMVACGQELVRGRFDHRAVGRQIAQLYERLAGERRRAPED